MLDIRCVALYKYIHRTVEKIIEHVKKYLIYMYRSEDMAPGFVYRGTRKPNSFGFYRLDPNYVGTTSYIGEPERLVINSNSYVRTNW